MLRLGSPEPLSVCPNRTTWEPFRARFERNREKETGKVARQSGPVDAPNSVVGPGDKNWWVWLSTVQIANRDQAKIRVRWQSNCRSTLLNSELSHSGKEKVGPVLQNRSTGPVR